MLDRADYLSALACEAVKWLTGHVYPPRKPSNHKRTLYNDVTSLDPKRYAGGFAGLGYCIDLPAKDHITRDYEGEWDWENGPPLRWRTGERRNPWSKYKKSFK